MAAKDVTTGLCEAIKQKLEYDPETGFIYFKAVGRGFKRRAGYIRQDGYIDIDITFDGSKNCLKAHRIAWFLATGEWPLHVIDHMNGDRQDNRIENLRDVTPKMNIQNVRAKVTRYGHPMGVQPMPGNKFRAEIQTDGSRFDLGVWESQAEAAAAYITAKTLLHAGYLGR